MATVEQITGAVKRLPKRYLARFRKWFAEYYAAVWDRQLEQDVAMGRLDKLAREALRDHKAGRTTEL
jgi:DNA repair photolyase